MNKFIKCLLLQACLIKVNCGEMTVGTRLGSIDTKDFDFLNTQQEATEINEQEQEDKEGDNTNLQVKEVLDTGTIQLSIEKDILQLNEIIKKKHAAKIQLLNKVRKEGKQKTVP